MIPRDHEFAERVLSLIPINGLEPQLQDEVLEQGELLPFKKKKVVFKEGARDPHTLYLLDGEIELQSSEASPVSVRADEDAARRALAQLQPRRYTARTVSPALVFRIERAVLDHILSDEQVVGDAGTVHVAELEEDDDEGDWMSRLLSSELFTRLPHDNIQRFFTELEPLEAAAGEVVVEQGTPGNYLYIVAEGRCSVTRRASGSGQEVELAVLNEGDTFGEESLISNTPCNASVKMQRGGFLMRLPKHSFEELASNPTLKAVPYSEACSLVAEGAMWIDVRFPDEHAAMSIEGSTNIALNTLRLEAPKLERSGRYVVYCDTGARSSSGAFLLARLGLDVSYLAGGLERTPLASGSTGSPAAEAPAAATPTHEAGPGFEFEMTSAAEPAPAEPAAEPHAAKPAAEPAPAEAPAAPAQKPPRAATADASAPAADEVPALRSQLATSKAERDKALAKLKQTTETAHELKRRFDEIRAAGKAEQTKRKALEAQLTKLEAEGERRVAMEKTRLEGELGKAVSKVRELQQQGQAAGRRVEEERSRLEGLLGEAEKRTGEALAGKDEAEATRVAAEVAFEDSLQSTRAELEATSARAERAERELEAVQANVAEAQASSDEAVRGKEEQDSAIEQAVQAALGDVGDENKRLEAERSRLAQELAAIESGQQEREASLRKQGGELEAQSAAHSRRTEELDRREMGVEHHRETVDAELSQREETVSSAEAALAEEKSAWRSEVEKAIETERDRLEAEYAKFKEEALDTDEQAAEQLAEQRVAEVRDEQEARAIELQTEHDAQMGALRAEAQAAVAKVRTHYETRLAEQEAMLEDERRRLETESVRFRDGLDAAQRIIKDLEATLAAESGAAAAPAPKEEAGADLELQLDIAVAPEPAKAAAAPVPKGKMEDDLELQLDPEMTAKPAPAAAARDEVPTIEMPDDVPTIEMPDDQPAEAPARSEAHRVLDPKQLADIRRKMQEKMKAAQRA